MTGIGSKVPRDGIISWWRSGKLAGAPRCLSNEFVVASSEDDDLDQVTHAQ